MFLQLEVFFGKASFILLLITMFYYWYQLSSKFSGPVITLIDKPNPYFQDSESLSPGTYSASMDSIITLPDFEQPSSPRDSKNQTFSTIFPLFMITSSVLSLFFLLILRWKEYGHFPLSNLYESLLFLCLCCLVVHLLTQSVLGDFENQGSTVMVSFVGSITSSSALCINAFASFSLPEEMQHGSALIPALQSNWLMMHVTVMITSYAALIIGSLFSIAYLIVDKTLPTQTDVNFGSQKPVIQRSGASDSHTPRPTLSSSLLQTLDNLSYRVIGLGFPLLTIGILSGAVWANEAWGSYWSWDPKETWALLTWLVFAIYLHTRLTRGWTGKNSAIMASLGFITVWVCFLGVNLLGEGLHSYGFLKK